MIVIAYYFIGSTAVKRIPSSRICNAKAMNLASGTKLGPNEIQSPLGASGMGEVYRARDSRLDRMVATTLGPRFDETGRAGLHGSRSRQSDGLRAS
jgi:hypothetical protein